MDSLVFGRFMGCLSSFLSTGRRWLAGAFPGSLTRAFRPALCALGCLVAGAASAAPSSAVGALDAFVSRLRTEYRDRLSVGREAARLGGEVRELVSAVLLEAAPEDSEPDAIVARESAVGRGLLVAADLFLAAGDTSQGLDAFRQASQQGAPETRALALYRLGEHYFFRRRYVPEQARAVSANYYWKELAARFPDSKWSEAIERPRRYLDTLGGGRTVHFDGTFRRGAEQARYSSETLAGKLVILNFWSTTLPDQKAFEAGLAKDMRSSIEEYPVLDGQIQVLGINLDPSAEAYERAVRDWEIPWPQAHDGQGFETEVAVQLAIPRLPHWCVIAPDGNLLYLGGNKTAFYQQATVAMKSLRRKLQAAE